MVVSKEVVEKSIERLKLAIDNGVYTCGDLIRAYDDLENIRDYIRQNI